MNYNEKELQNLISVFTHQMKVQKKKLRKDYFQLLSNAWINFQPTEEDKKVLDNYLNKEVLVYLDNQAYLEWFILEDNNYLIPNVCFENT